MFGREFSQNPEILVSSFEQMHDSYRKIAKKKNTKLINVLQKIYISLFGIPEIGFQIRSLFFESMLKKRLSGKKIYKIMDAGSGIGMYTYWLARQFPNAQVEGGEIDREKIAFCQKFTKKIKAPNISFRYFDVTKPSRDKYDLIVNIDVLEHIENFKSVLKNFAKSLNSNGYIFIHTPQPEQRRIFNSLRSWQHEDHTREGYTPEELKGELKKLGFKIVSLRETFGFFGKLAWELNHISFKKGFVVAGILYPILFLIATLDLLSNNKNGLCTAILAKKP
jgi:2-polyprenyl-3-methyl-5-hydroxy-6-metoxy-1,4-benzoquinol methylase